MSDLVDRHAALNALIYAVKNVGVLDAGDIRTVFKALPTIQPEVLACGNGELVATPELHWIPVSERLPEEYGEYLVTKRIIGWNCEEYDVNDIAYFDDDGFPKADRVLAWMPLPEAYKPNK